MVCSPDPSNTGQDGLAWGVNDVEAIENPFVRLSGCCLLPTCLNSSLDRCCTQSSKVDPLLTVQAAEDEAAPVEAPCASVGGSSRGGANGASSAPVAKVG